MDLSVDASYAFPRAVVFEAYRDHLVELLPYLPNVRSIEVRSREEKGAVVDLVNVWHGGGEIPAAARAILRESMLSWTDRATWDAEALTCEWRVEPHSFADAVTCHGRHTFVEADGGTRLEMRGILRIDAAKVKAVPRFVASRVGPIVEEFLVARIQPNMVEVSRGLARYLEARK